MKKNILTMAALLIASATVFTACSSDDNIIGEQPAQGTKTYTMTINASKGGDATTRALSLGRNDADTKNVLNATWATTENVYVKKGDTWATGSLQPEADGATATLKGTLTGITPASSDVLTLQFPRSGERDYSGQVGTLADIAAKYDYATATVTVADVSATGNIIPEEATTTFTNQQAIVKFTLIDKADGTTSLNATQLVVNDGTTDYTITPASATSEIYAAIPGFTSKTVKLTATVGNKTYTYAKASQSFTNGQYYEITVKMTEKPDLLSGVFSVSSTKKVKFSKGNLRYASGTWSFFDNQYDYYTSYSADAWDHFGWSTSATTYGMNTSQSSEDYSGDFVDWGATIGTGWRTLSSAEWEWMLGPDARSTWISPTPGTNCRTSSTIGGVTNARWVKAVVHSAKGLIIYPDALTWNEATMGTAPTTSNAANDYFTYNTLTDAQWSALEAAGCVFLPAAGLRNQESVNSAGSSGFYWSSSPEDTSTAYYVNFYSDGLYPTNYHYRDRGYSVRLVRQVE